MADANTQIVQQIYAAFGRGDVAGIMQHVSDELRRFGVVCEDDGVPWHMQITKKADVPRFFKALSDTMEFTRFEPRDFAEGGDHVYCTVSFDATFRRNGKTLTQDHSLHHFAFKNGKVVEWRGSEDTARVMAVFNA